MRKTDMVGLRIPFDLLTKIDTMKDREGIDRTTLILRALRYWVSVDGNVTTDNEYLNRINNLEKNVAAIADGMSDVKQLKELLSEQQKVIGALVKMIPKYE